MNTERKTPGLLFPLLLIAAGALLLADQLGVMSISLTEYIGLWPLLLVLFGLEALLRALRAPALIASSAALVLCLLAGLTLQPALFPNTEPEVVSYSYPVEDVESGMISLHSRISSIAISAGSANSDTLFVVDIAEPAGLADIETTGERANDGFSLSVEDKSHSASTFVGADISGGDWQAQINPSIATSIDATTGVGKISTALADASLSDIILETGMGSITAVLPDGGYEASLETGIGRVSLDLADDVAARITINEGLGQTTVGDHYRLIDGFYVTPAFSADAPYVSVQIEVGIGSVALN